jgi:ribonuclease M5
MKIGFVVEGFNDEAKVLSVVPNAVCSVTKGTRMNNRVRMDVENLLKFCGKVLLIN